jgi:hypothetical protein
VRRIDMDVHTTPDIRLAPVDDVPAAAGEVPRQARGGLRIAFVLSAFVAVLMGFASAAGLFASDLYLDGAWARQALRDGDLVTLFVVVPILTTAILLALRGSERAQAVWIGVLAYAVYNYAYYAFGATFNDLFLIHIALLSISIFPLVFVLPNLDGAAIADRLHNPRRARWIGGFLAIVGVLQGALWLFVVLRNALTGEVLHDIPVAGQHLVFALDLSLLVPSLILAGVLLWRQTPMGYVFGAVMCVMGALYQVNLMLAGVFQANGDVAGVKAFPPEGLFLTAGFVVSALLLMSGRRTNKIQGAGERRSQR